MNILKQTTTNILKVNRNKSDIFSLTLQWLVMRTLGGVLPCSVPKQHLQNMNCATESPSTEYL